MAPLAAGRTPGSVVLAGEAMEATGQVLKQGIALLQQRLPVLLAALLQLLQLGCGLVARVDELVEVLPGGAAHGFGKAAHALLQLFDLPRPGFDLHAFLVQNRFLQLGIGRALIIAIGSGGQFCLVVVVIVSVSVIAITNAPLCWLHQKCCISEESDSGSLPGFS